jgi:hypothetical protein
MLSADQAFWLQFTTICVVLLSPIIAVLITLWHQNRQTKRNAKMQLFMDLVSFRDHVPFTWQYVVALNRIDVVFHKQEDILRIWHEYYDLILQPQTEIVKGQVKEKTVALISEIAKHLGYHNIDQIFLQRYYQPKGHFDEFVNNYEIRTELLRVLKSTEVLFLLGKYEETPFERDLKAGLVDRKKLTDIDKEKEGGNK